MPVVREDPQDRDRREAQEREYLKEVEERRLQYNLELARLESDVAHVRARHGGWIRLLLWPVLLVATLGVVILQLNDKPIPDILEDLLRS